MEVAPKESRYQKYRESIIKSTMKYRQNHREQYNQYQKNRYNTNEVAREKKKALMRAYSAKRRAERKQAKTT